MDFIFGLLPADLPTWLRVLVAGIGCAVIALIGSLDIVLGEIDR